MCRRLPSFRRAWPSLSFAPFLSHRHVPLPRHDDSALSHLSTVTQASRRYPIRSRSALHPGCRPTLRRTSVRPLLERRVPLLIFFRLHCSDAPAPLNAISTACPASRDQMQSLGAATEPPHGFPLHPIPSALRTLASSALQSRLLTIRSRSLDRTLCVGWHIATMLPHTSLPSNRQRCAA